MKKGHLLVFIAIVFIATACAQKPSEQNLRTLTVMTHDSFAVSDSVVASFEETNQVKVQFLEVGDTGTAVNKAALSKDNPLADVFLRGGQYFPQPGAGGRDF